MFIRSQALRPSLRYHFRQKLLGHVRLQQPVPVFGKHRRVPHRVVGIQAYKPAEQQVVIHFFHQQPLAADRIQHLQQLRPQQLLRRDRRPSNPGIHTVEPSRQPAQHLIDHHANGTQRMIRAHAHLGGQITEHMILLMIFSTHAFSYHGRLWISSIFPHPARAIRLSHEASRSDGSSRSVAHGTVDRINSYCRNPTAPAPPLC